MKHLFGLILLFNNIIDQKDWFIEFYNWFDFKILIVNKLHINEQIIWRVSDS